MRAVLSNRLARRVEKSRAVISFCVTLAIMGKRQESREKIEAQIVELGRRHLVTEGAAGLSLRAIARDLGMVSSAVYRYVASRDDLLTLLLVDAYSELADAVDARAATRRAVARSTARDGARGPRVGGRSAARWALLYGSPVPGYHAPRERTVGPGTRVVGRCSTRSRRVLRPAIFRSRMSLRPNRCRRFRPDSRGVRVRRRRPAVGQVLSALGRPGRRHQPRGVRPIWRRRAGRSAVRVRHPAPAAHRHADYPELTRHR
jgi:AcrR family transcriptional regulator